MLAEESVCILKKKKKMLMLDGSSKCNSLVYELV